MSSGTFGSSLCSQAGKDRIPSIVAKCIMEIDERGIGIKGLYRVSGVKSKVEKLCEAFESGSTESVDLSDVHPNVIANVLKLYFRQLPEPLLTIRLYQDFIKVAKEYPASTRVDPSSGVLVPHRSLAGSASACSISLMKSAYNQSENRVIRQLAAICSKLPKPHYLTLGYLIHHLKRVSEQSEINNMPSSNLGIVFGPTLLRTSEGGNPTSSFVDTVHQTRVIDLLITYSTEIFGNPFGVTVQGHVVGLYPEASPDSTDANISYPQGSLEVCGEQQQHRRRSAAAQISRQVAKVFGQSTRRDHSSNTQKSSGRSSGLWQSPSGIINHNSSRNSSTSGSSNSKDSSVTHGQYSSSVVITVPAQKQVAGTSNFSPIKSASLSAIPSSLVSVPLRVSGATSPASGSSSGSISSDQSHHQQMRAYMQELRRQFFMTPCEGFNYFPLTPPSPRKDTGGSTTDEDLAASGNHARLKRVSEPDPKAQRTIIQQQPDIIDDHNPQYSSRGSITQPANWRLRFMESDMLSRSASAINPFSSSSRPESNPSRKASNPRLRIGEGEMLSRSASALNPFSPRPPEHNPTKHQRPKFL